jgi:hypothetical protein
MVGFVAMKHDAHMEEVELRMVVGRVFIYI